MLMRIKKSSSIIKKASINKELNSFFKAKERLPDMD